VLSAGPGRSADTVFLGIRGFVATQAEPVIISVMANPRIVQIEISSIPRPKPLGLFDPTPVVTATFDDGSRKRLFSFYLDEIVFDEGDLVGLTEAEAHDLYRRKDTSYLRTP